MSANHRSLLLLGLAAFASGFLIVPSAPAQASEEHVPEIKVYSSGDLALEKTFFAYDQGMKNGVHVATGDVNGDGKEEIITAPLKGASPHVRVVSMRGVQMSFSHMVFTESFKKGVNIAAGDLDGDGKDEIIVAQADEQAFVKVYRYDGTIMANFLAYPQDYRHGAMVATGDLNGDGKDEIITATSIGAKSHIRSFDQHGNFAGLSIFPFHPGFNGGTSLATLDVENDGKDEIVLGQMSRGDSRIKVYRGNGTNAIVANFLAFPAGHQGGVHIATGDVNQDGKADIIAGIGNGSRPQVKMFTSTGGTISKTLYPYPSDFMGGVNVAVGNLDGDATNDIVIAPAKFVVPSGEKKIVVDLSEQRLYAYQGDVVTNTFLISSGIAKYPTPTGNFSVLKKIPVKRYKWEYGPFHPDNYDLPNVTSNLQFSGNYYLHSAYWHHNFGHRMSHGCVNISPTNARWVYDWAEMGTPVIIRN